MKSNKNIHIVGLGGGGCNALEYIYNQRFEAEYTCITFPPRSLPRKIQFISFSPEISFPDFPQGCVEEKHNLPEDIEGLFETDQRYVLLAGLGGYTGTFLIKALFEYLPIHKRDYMAICSYPFKFEGIQRMQTSESMTHTLKHAANFKSFNMDSIIGECSNKTILEILNRADMEFYRILKANV